MTVHGLFFLAQTEHNQRQQQPFKGTVSAGSKLNFFDSIMNQPVSRLMDCGKILMQTIFFYLSAKTNFK